MTSLLISSGAMPITTEEVRSAIGLQTRALDGLIAAAIAKFCVDDEIVPTVWDESPAATERKRAEGHNPTVIGNPFEGNSEQWRVRYEPTEKQIYITRQRIVIWLLQQDDVLDVRAEEVRARLAETTITISAEQTR